MEMKSSPSSNQNVADRLGLPRLWHCGSNGLNSGGFLGSWTVFDNPFGNVEDYLQNEMHLVSTPEDVVAALEIPPEETS